MERQIPNYIVVGQREKVMAKAVFSKAAGNKLEMCSDCFSTYTGHFKRAPGCDGLVKWGSYCKLFEDDWQLMFREREQQLLQEQLQVGQGRTVRTVGEVSRVSALEKRLSDELAEVEKEKEATSVGQQGFLMFMEITLLCIQE